MPTRAPTPEQLHDRAALPRARPHRPPQSLDVDGLARARLTCPAGTSGADVVQEPAHQPFGVRDCAVRDPAGNLVRINERG